MRRTLIGIVTRDKTAKTRRVEVARQYPHPKYGKIVHDRTICHVHDEHNESRSGDEVEIASPVRRAEAVGTGAGRACGGGAGGCGGQPGGSPESESREEST